MPWGGIYMTRCIVRAALLGLLAPITILAFSSASQRAGIKYDIELKNALYLLSVMLWPGNITLSLIESPSFLTTLFLISTNSIVYAIIATLFCGLGRISRGMSYLALLPVLIYWSILVKVGL
jgi:hypothetical protein